MIRRKNNLTTECNNITKSEVSNHHHKKSMFLFLVIAMTTSLLSVPTIIVINTQAYPPSAGSIPSSINNSTRSSTTGVTQMGICLVGAGGPCNGDSNWDGTHDVTGKCVLLNGCGNDNNGNTNNNNSTNNNIVAGK